MMDAARCRKCGHFWAFTQTVDRDSILTKICPTCIGTLLPTLNWSLIR